MNRITHLRERFPALKNRPSVRGAGFVLVALLIAMLTTIIVALDSILPDATR